jgi:hypothetical protein
MYLTFQGQLLMYAVATPSFCYQIHRKLHEMNYPLLFFVIKYELGMLGCPAACITDFENKLIKTQSAYLSGKNSLTYNETHD